MPPKKTLAQLGRVEGEGISFQAHIQYRDEQDKRNKNIHIRGPTRSSRRRAERDLLSIRKASEGHSDWAEAIAAIYAKSRELSQEAEFEANVALGLAQYGFVRDAHKVVDSDLESEGDAPVGHDAADKCAKRAKANASMHTTKVDLRQEAETEARVAMGINECEAQRLAHTIDVEDSDMEAQTEGDDDQDGVLAEDFADPKVLDKLFPPPAPKEPVRPPQDAKDATIQLARFRYPFETPSVLTMLLSARADSNVVAKEGDLPPLQTAILLAHPRHVHEFRETLLAFGATNGREERNMWHRRQQRDLIDPIYVAKLRRLA